MKGRAGLPSCSPLRVSPRLLQPHLRPSRGGLHGGYGSHPHGQSQNICPPVGCHKCGPRLSWKTKSILRFWEGKATNSKSPLPQEKTWASRCGRRGGRTGKSNGLPEAGAALQGTGTDGTVPHRPAGPSRGLRGAAATAGSLRQGPARSGTSCPALELVGSWERGGDLPASERAAGREGGSPLALPLTPPLAPPPCYFP